MMHNIVLAATLLVSLGLIQNVDLVLGTSHRKNLRISPRCFFSKEPKFNGSVDLHFFNSKHHSSETYGCGSNLRIRLDINKSISNNYKRFQDLVLGNKNIQRDLIDCGEFNPELDTYFFIHGFYGGWNSDPIYCSIKDLVLDNTEANFFLVDWSSGSIPEGGFLNYGQSVVDTEYVGQLLGKFILSLMKHSGQANADRYHVVGHSLGAHVASFIGDTLGRENKLGRITALDPAGPCFTIDRQTTDTVRKATELGILPGDKRRLSASSAKLVVAIHTDSLGLGVADNVGHYDVFLNGGTKNPACAIRGAEPFCDHFYSTKVLDTFAQLISDDQKEYRAFSSNTTKSSSCFPMAYTCRSWESFKSGECGVCKDGDTKCILMGFGHNRQAIPTSFGNPDRSRDKNNYLDSLHDRRYNFEASEIIAGRDGQLANIARRITTYAARDRAYIVSDLKQPSCRYSYQVVIAASNSKNKHERKRFYLQIPLDISHGLIDGKNGLPVTSRLVRVTNDVTPGSESHSRLSAELDIPHDQRSTTTYYTALITFSRNLQSCMSHIDVATEGWKLRKPIKTPLMYGAKLWSKNKDHLSSARLVALNYMSGYTEQLRQQNSFLSDVKKAEIIPRAKISAIERPAPMFSNRINDGDRSIVAKQELQFAKRL